MNKLLARLLALLAMLAPALLAVIVTIEAIRTGRFILGAGSVAESIPEDFYSSASFLPPGVLDNAGWVVAICIMWIVIGALLFGRAAIQRVDQARVFSR
ncbi:hypothetical protein [Arthrobacter rhombi]|uniref:hypothetical protein n=1 Tax=Arthrobacter rhombi TaxID=71253 RepID=UPI003FD45BA8